MQCGVSFAERKPVRPPQEFNVATVMRFPSGLGRAAANTPAIASPYSCQSVAPSPGFKRRPRGVAEKKSFSVVGVGDVDVARSVVRHAVGDATQDAADPLHSAVSDNDDACVYAHRFFYQGIRGSAAGC